MSVTQNYKSVTFSADALMYVKDAVMARLISDKARIEVAKDSAFIDFLRREIATGTEVLNSLSSGDTNIPIRVSAPSVDRGEAMKIAAIAVRFMLHVEARMGERVSGSLYDALKDQVRVNPAALRTSLLFLESPK